ncbi:MAG: hypothetical protein FIB01_04855 [Gemmatimonadetes bacterium]|nr:hypothetical protein [Gemmatimonadota bacterium]
MSVAANCCPICGYSLAGESCCPLCLVSTPDQAESPRTGRACRDCGLPQPRGALVCESCGAELPSSRTGLAPTVKLVLGFSLLALFFLVFNITVQLIAH